MKNVFPPRALPRNATVPYLSDGFFGHPTLSTWFTSEYKKSGKKLDMGKGYGSSGGIAVQKVVAQTAIAAFNCVLWTLRSELPQRHFRVT